MKDLAIALENHPGALADMGEALGRAGVSVKGGGAWVHEGRGIAHFLFDDGAAARTALEASGITVLAERDVLVQRLNQDQPGQPGKLTRSMAEAKVNIETLYSDHDHRMILVVDDQARGSQVSEQWEQERASKSGPPKPTHHYSMSVEWTGNDGVGTQTYRSYRRDHIVSAQGKVPIDASSDPAFRGDPSRYNPEELFIAAISSCHMLWYLHLCAVNGVVVTKYKDDAAGIMQEDAKGSGFFKQITLHPKITITDAAFQERAKSLHHEAHELCFLARSVNFDIDIDPEITAS
ncbi:MAG: OsmC family protein [Acidobacteriaceae bacterium]